MSRRPRPDPPRARGIRPGAPSGLPCARGIQLRPQSNSLCARGIALRSQSNLLCAQGNLHHARGTWAPIASQIALRARHLGSNCKPDRFARKAPELRSRCKLLRAQGTLAPTASRIASRARHPNSNRKPGRFARKAPGLRSRCKLLRAWGRTPCARGIACGLPADSACGWRVLPGRQAPQHHGRGILACTPGTGHHPRVSWACG